MSDITDQAAEDNRIAWNSFRRQRDEGLAKERNDSAQDILEGRLRLSREVIQLAGNVSGKRLLDMGCGEGAETLEWARLGAEVVGVDNSPKQLEAAQRNAEKLGISCRWIQGDLSNLPDELETGDFDIAFSLWVTAWIGDKEAWFRSVYRALKPDGVFILGGGHPVGGYLEEIADGLNDRDSYFEEGPFTYETDDHTFNPARERLKTVEWSHTMGSMITTLAHVGFRITDLIELPADKEEDERRPVKGLPGSFVLRAERLDILRGHNVTLTSGNIVLRPMTEKDWDLLLKWNSDAEVLYYAAGGDVTGGSLEDVQDLYRSVSQAAICFVIEVDGKPIGDCWLQRMNMRELIDLFPGQDLRRIDLIIGEKDYWNRGIGSEVIGMLTRFGFEDQHADAIFGLVEGHNPRSRRAFEKNGYMLHQEHPTDSPKAEVAWDLMITREAFESRNG
jgi:ubiquinone/menaquinone biosynthesis C-methylase UbiE/RimJ/RimL family protein N-acetyltransferase